VKKLGSYLNSKCLKQLTQVLRQKLSARHKLSAPTVYPPTLHNSVTGLFSQQVLLADKDLQAIGLEWLGLVSDRVQVVIGFSFQC
jgi:hypothetical protein